MTYAKQNIQAAGSACSRLRVTWHGQKLAHHLRGNLRARWVFQDSFHDDWRHETKKLGSRCHYAFAQGVPLRLALSPLGCGFERAKRAHPKSWGEKVRKWESENWRFRLWVDLFGRIRFPVLAGRVDSNTQPAFFPALARLLPAVQPWLVIYRLSIDIFWPNVGHHTIHGCIASKYEKNSPTSIFR